MIKQYKVRCFRCRNEYLSADVFDKDGNGSCEPCKERSKKIALEVDERMKKIREARGPNPLIIKPGGNWVKKDEHGWITEYGRRL